MSGPELDERRCHEIGSLSNVSRRMERVASLIRTVLAEAIRERLSDPRIEPLTSITRVEVSADLAAARVFVSVMAPEARQKLSVDALQHAAGRLRSAVAEQVTLRLTPRLTFQLDDSVQRSLRTVDQLDRIRAELDARAGIAGPEAPAGDAAGVGGGEERTVEAADGGPGDEGGGGLGGASGGDTDGLEATDR